jgi:signal transduction histidine kinase
LLQKQQGPAAGLEELLKLAKEKLAALKTAAGSVSGKDEKNKEVVTTAKKGTQESIAAAKEAVKNVKEKVTAHKKLVSGIRKAASGINTKIFPAVEPKEDKTAKKE